MIRRWDRGGISCPRRTGESETSGLTRFGPRTPRGGRRTAARAAAGERERDGEGEGESELAVSQSAGVHPARMRRGWVGTHDCLSMDVEDGYSTPLGETSMIRVGDVGLSTAGHSGTIGERCEWECLE